MNKNIGPQAKNKKNKNIKPRDSEDSVENIILSDRDNKLEVHTKKKADPQDANHESSKKGNDKKCKIYSYTKYRNPDSNGQLLKSSANNKDSQIEEKKQARGHSNRDYSDRQSDQES